MPNQSSLFISNVKWVYAGKLVAQLFNVISAVLVIQNLSVEIYGTFTLLMSTYFVFHVLGLSAIINVSNRFIPEFVQKDQIGNVKKLLFLLLLVLVSVMAILLFLLYVFRSEFADLFNIENIDGYIARLIILVSVSALKNVSDIVLKDLLLNAVITRLSIFLLPLRLCLYLLVVKELNVGLLLRIEIVILTLNVVFNLFYIVRHLKASLTEWNDKDSLDAIRLARYAGYSFLNELGVGIVGNKMNVFIVSALGTPTLVGIYAFTSKLNNLVMKMLPLTELKAVIRPLFFRRYGSNERKEDISIMKEVMIKILFPVYLFPVAVFLLFGKFLIAQVFGDQYVTAYPYVVILLSTNLVIAVFFPLGLTAFLEEKLNYVLISKIVLLGSIPLAFIGFGHYGLYAVVFANLVGNLMKNIVLMICMMRDGYSVRYMLSSLSKFVPVIIIIAISYLLIPTEISVSVFILSSVLLTVGIAAVVYYFRLFSSAQMELLFKVFSSNTMIINWLSRLRRI